jgi:NitT/TauT family transport system substrate-binding protein
MATPDRSGLLRSLTRRQALRAGGLGLAGTGAALLFGCGDDGEPRTQPSPGASPSPSGAPGGEPPPEVTTIRLPRLSTPACYAPLLMAEDYLHDEGFTDVHYIPREARYSLIAQHLVNGTLDMAMLFAPDVSYAVDRDVQVVMLGGAQAACFEMFAPERIRNVSDLRGARIGMLVRDPEPGDYAFITSVLQHIDLRDGRDVELIAIPPGTLRGGAFDDGRIDALFAAVPEAVSMRTTQQGHVILNGMTDTPWDQHFCCYFVANREFAERNPVATKRALRALLNGLDLCHAEPDLTAQRMFDQGWTSTVSIARASMDHMQFDVWRRFDSEASLRFYTLLLHEAGLIESTPDQIIEKGTDFSHFNELKQEMALFAAPQPKRAAAFKCDLEAAPRYALRGPSPGRGPARREI